MGAARERKLLSHEALRPLSMGCLACPESEMCGGNYSSLGIFDCGILCQCDNPSKCSNVCLRNENFVARIQEIGGFDLNNIPRIQVSAYPKLPLISPVIYHGYRRRELLEVPAVTVPLRKLFRQKTGEIKFQSKKELAESFKFNENAHLIISGSDKDAYIENYWSHRRIRKLPEMLARLEPALITSPNFSMVLGVVRTDNLYNLKRIGIVWHELASQGINAALHVNARTDWDWERWAIFVKEREEVQSIAFEFATGSAVHEYGLYYVKKLIELADYVGRDLQLVIKGGLEHVGCLHDKFPNLVFLDSSSFIKTVYRKRLNWQPGDKLTCSPKATKKGELLDSLMNENVGLMGRMIDHQVRSRITTGKLFLVKGLHN